MEGLILNCDYEGGDSVTFRPIQKGEIEVVAESDDGTEIAYYYKKEKARQLHEWLGRYLENCDE